jgi:hypothetical protein
MVFIKNNEIIVTSIFIAVVMLLFNACSTTPSINTPTHTPTSAIPPTNTATTTYTATSTLTPTQKPTITPTSAATSTLTDTPTETLAPLNEPESGNKIRLAITNSTDQSIIIRLEAVGKSGNGYKLVIPAGEKKLFDIAAINYQGSIQACDTVLPWNFNTKSDFSLSFTACFNQTPEPIQGN